MKIQTLSAKNLKEMENISNKLCENKFKINSRDENFILLRKRRCGNIYIHLFFLFVAFFLINIAIIVNVAYFSYSYLFKSPHVLITTETVDHEGNPLKFDNIEEVIEKSNSFF